MFFSLGVSSEVQKRFCLESRQRGGQIVFANCLQNSDCLEFCKHQMARPRFLQTNLMAKFCRNFWGHHDKSTAERISSEFCKQNHNKKLYMILVHFSMRHLWHHLWMRGTQQWHFSPPTTRAIDMTMWWWCPLPPPVRATSGEGHLRWGPPHCIFEPTPCMLSHNGI
jgi:hypothetical protein